MRPITAAIAAATATAIVVSSSFAIAAIPNSSTKVITGCYLKTSGTLRVIDKQANKTCKTTEIELSWNQQGVTGPIGPAGRDGTNGINGSPGAVGPKGDPGASGANGADGAPALQGPAGALSCSEELRIHAAVSAFAVRTECLPQPVTIFDNLGSYSGQGGGGSGATGASYGNPPGNNDVAAGFDVAAGPNINLDSITLRSMQLAGPNVIVSLLGDRPKTGFGSGTSEPDLTNVIETWTLSAGGSYPSEHTVHSVSHPLLIAGHRYWVVLSGAEPTSGVWWWMSENVSVGQLSAERNQLFVSWGLSPTAWNSNVFAQTYAMRLIGTAA